MEDEIPYTNLDIRCSTSSTSSTSSLTSVTSKTSTSSDVSTSSLNSNTECNICYNAFDKTNKIVLPCCEKKICTTCVFDWHVKKRGDKCMFCRAQVIDIPRSPSNIDSPPPLLALTSRSSSQSPRIYCTNCIVMGFASLVLIIIYLYNQTDYDNISVNTTRYLN